jgi:hypothetical protein
MGSSCDGARESECWEYHNKQKEGGRHLLVPIVDDDDEKVMWIRGSLAGGKKISFTRSYFSMELSWKEYQNRIPLRHDFRLVEYVNSSRCIFNSMFGVDGS